MPEITLALLLEHLFKSHIDYIMKNLSHSGSDDWIKYTVPSFDNEKDSIIFWVKYKNGEFFLKSPNGYMEKVEGDIVPFTEYFLKKSWVTPKKMEKEEYLFKGN